MFLFTRNLINQEYKLQYIIKLTDVSSKFPKVKDLKIPTTYIRFEIRPKSKMCHKYAIFNS